MARQVCSEVRQMKGKKTRPAAQSSSARAHPSAAAEGGAGASANPDVKPYVIHVNTKTRQVLKVEELDLESGKRKEIAMNPLGYDAHSYDPYGAYSQAGYDPS